MDQSEQCDTISVIPLCLAWDVNHPFVQCSIVLYVFLPLVTSSYFSYYIDYDRTSMFVLSNIYLTMAPKCKSNDIGTFTMYCDNYSILLLVIINLLLCLMYKLNLFIGMYVEGKT